MPKRKLESVDEPPKKRRCIPVKSEGEELTPIKTYKRTKARLRNDTKELIGRTKERKKISNFWKNCLEEKKGNSLYISGAPGCGKTALLRELHSYFEEYEKKKNMVRSRVLYINCMQLQTADSLFKHLCTSLNVPGITGKGKISPEQLLRKYLGKKRAVPKKKSKARVLEPDGPCGMIVLIADEIDRLKTSDNHVLYSLFELSAIPNSPLILLAIANALDMTDRILPRLLNSHCEPETLHFTPYSSQQISSIIHTRLRDVGGVIEEDAIDFCAGKVAAQSADVRSALEIMRSAVQIVHDQYEEEMEKNDGKEGPLKTVGIIAVNRACRPSSPVIKVIQALPQQQKYVLCALTMLALSGKSKPTIPQVINTCSKIPFAKTMRKPDVVTMIAQLRENGLVSAKKNVLSVDEEDVQFAFEETPLYQFIQLDEN